MTRRHELHEAIPTVIFALDAGSGVSLQHIYEQIETDYPHLVDTEMEPSPGGGLKWRHDVRWEIETLISEGTVFRRKDLGSAMYSRSPASRAMKDEIHVPALVRRPSFDDDTERAVTIAAAEAVLEFIRPFRDPEASPLDAESWALLDASGGTLEAQIRNSRVNILILTAAIGDAVSAVAPWIQYPADDVRVDASQEIVERASNMGQDDAEADGHEAQAILISFFNVPTDPVAEEPTWSDEAKAGARRGALSGIEDLAHRAVVGTPSTIAQIAGVIALWASLPPSASNGVVLAWLVVRFVLGAFRRRS